VESQSIVDMSCRSSHADVWGVKPTLEYRRFTAQALQQLSNKLHSKPFNKQTNMQSILFRPERRMKMETN
jgi:hypothetical protein